MFCSGKSIRICLLLIGTSFASIAQSAPTNRILQAIDVNRRAVLRGSARPFAKPEFDLGRVDANMPINGVSLNFKLSPNQQAELQALLREQQDRSSPSYHKWLTPEQYGGRFGMNRADLTKVTSWLQSQGFEVIRVSRSRTRISFSGTTSQLDSAFRTEIHHYLVNGEMHFANAPSSPCLRHLPERSCPSAISATCARSPGTFGRRIVCPSRSHPTTPTAALAIITSRPLILPRSTT